MAKAINFGDLMKNPPACPLCGTKMVAVKDQVRNIWVFACHTDRIMIAVTDPLVGRWSQKMEKIPCPLCDTAMRVFYTSVGFMKAKCPKKKCGASITGSNPDRLSMAPALKLDGV